MDGRSGVGEGVRSRVCSPAGARAAKEACNKPAPRDARFTLRDWARMACRMLINRNPNSKPHLTHDTVAGDGWPVSPVG